MVVMASVCILSSAAARLVYRSNLLSPIVRYLNFLKQQPEFTASIWEEPEGFIEIRAVASNSFETYSADKEWQYVVVIFTWYC